MLNYKLSSNINDLGANIGGVSKDEDYRVGALNIDDDTNEEIYNRK